MPSQWIAGRLTEHGFGLVLFPYEPAKMESLPSGQQSAMRSARVWQEQIMTPAFQVPDTAETGIHPHSGTDPDAVSFRYLAHAYTVTAFHLMDRLAITLRPAKDQPARTWSNQESREEAARLAVEVFQNTGELVFETEKNTETSAYGRRKIPAGKDPAQLFPVETIEWWYGDNEFGFTAQKVTPVIGDRYPSSMGLSPQQVLIWFDTFGMKRTVK